MTAIPVRRQFPWLIACCAVTVLACFPLCGQETTTKPVNENPAEKFSDFRALKSLDGKWKTTIRSWSDKAGGSPVESTGKVEFKTVLGGKFVHESASGKMATTDFSGIGYWGYNENRKKFTRVWMDSLTSMTIQSEGTIDNASQTITLYGRMDDKTSEQGDKMMRWELVLSDPKKITLKMFDLSINKDAKVLEIVYEKDE